MTQKKTTRRKTTAKKKPAAQKPAKDLTVADGIAVHCACDQIVAMGKIKLYPANANKHPQKQVALLAKLINRHGWRGPITISNQSGFVVRGHGRFAAAQLLEVSEIPVDFQSYESEQLERADRLADNKIQELSEWDRDILRHELGELDTGVLDDTDLTGFTAPDLEELFTAAPPPPGGGGGDDPAYGDGVKNDPQEGSNWGQSGNHGKEGRIRCAFGDLDIFIPPEVYEQLKDHLRDGREATGDDYPDLFQRILERGMGN